VEGQAQGNESDQGQALDGILVMAMSKGGRRGEIHEKRTLAFKAAPKKAKKVPQHGNVEISKSAKRGGQASATSGRHLVW
jgi:hypothetical protein